MKALNRVSWISQFCRENCGNSRPGEVIENSRISHRLCDRYQVSLAIPKLFNARNKEAPSISNADRALVVKSQEWAAVILGINLGIFPLQSSPQWPCLGMTSAGFDRSLMWLHFPRNFPACPFPSCHGAGHGEKSALQFPLSTFTAVFSSSACVFSRQEKARALQDCCLKWNSNQSKGWLSRQPLTRRCAGLKRAAWLHKWKCLRSSEMLLDVRRKKGDSYANLSVCAHTKLEEKLWDFLANFQPTVLKWWGIRTPFLSSRIWH